MTDTTVTKYDTRVFFALAWMGVALASFSTIAIAGRQASRGIATLDMICYRSLITLAMVLIPIMMGPGLAAMRTQRLRWHVARNCVHFIAQYSWLAALTMIPLAQLFALEFTAPIWVACLAPLLLGERLTRTRVISAVLGFTGLLIVARPGVIPLSVGVSLGMLAALGFALSMLTTKSLTRTEQPLQILFFMFAIQSAISIVLLSLFGSKTLPDLGTFGWITCLSLAGLTGHYALVRAFSLADAIIVAPMDFLRLPLIAVVGALLYNEPLDLIVLFGGLVIIAGNLTNLWGERRGLPKAE